MSLEVLVRHLKSTKIVVIMEGIEWGDIEGEIVEWDYHRVKAHPAYEDDRYIIDGIVLKRPSGDIIYVRWDKVQAIFEPTHKGEQR